MALPSQEQTERFVREFMTECNNIVLESKLKPQRLPGWLKKEKARFGWVNDSLVIVVEDSIEEKKYEYRGHVGADTVILFDVENFILIGEPSIKIPSYSGTLSLVGEQGTIFNLTGEYPAFLDCGFGSHHNPVMLFNLFFQQFPPSNLQNGPLRASFVPFALYVHKREVENYNQFLESIRSRVRDMLTNVHNSKQGDYYEEVSTLFDVFQASKKSTVIVLGKDSPETFLKEMLQIRDLMIAKGYSAHIIKQLPEISQMSVEEKVGLWTCSCKTLSK
jgi:hypothetical protein